VLWLILGLVFCAPFFDPRRPFRLLHLDLVALAVVGLPLIQIREAGGSTAEQDAAIVLVAVALSYLLARMLLIGFRPRRPLGALVPVVPLTWLVVAVIALVGFRMAYVRVDSTVVADVGRVSVYGANRIAEGRGLYDEPLSENDPQGNTYGPVMYLMYLPFERVVTWTAQEDRDALTYGELVSRDNLTARAAAVSFDLLALAGLFLLGRRLRPRDGNALAVVLAFAWVSCPYPFNALKYGTNDSLVAALIVGALLALASPPLRGAFTALASAAKFAPAALAPLLATAADRQRRVRSAILFTGTFVLVSLASFRPFIPDGGLRELYDRTLGFQAGRTVGSSIWWLFPSLEPLQVVTRVAAVALAVAVAFVPVRKGPLQVAALGAAVIIAFQLAVTFWAPAYVAWFVPLLFVAVFAAYGPGQLFGRAGQDPVGGSGGWHPPSS
jgi:hypothetical protein